MDALQKEMLDVGLAFEILEDDAHITVGWKPAIGHLIWDIKLKGAKKS